MSIRVLYAEDEVFLGKIVRETLQLRGFDVQMETDGAQVPAAFTAYQPDICVLDVMLPNRSGFELAAAIRQLNEDVPIIFLTAKTQTEDVVQGFRLGGNDYIRKPFSMEELIVRIEHALRIKKEDLQAPAPEILLMGKYRFLVKKQVLTWNNQEKKLSYRESELLKYLYQHKEEVIDRRELLN
ncbi:MAG TPA: response regulator transcription factor, partial [Sediminibacterium sp.]|nr:response regulator transcription factor [Sediminibacterium sp.]